MNRHRQAEAALAILVLLAGCREEKPVEKVPVPVTVSVAESYSGGTKSPYSASIVANVQVSLAFKSAGYVTDVLQVKSPAGGMRYVDQGDWVKKGTVLATVREDDYRNAVQQAEGQLSQAQAAALKAQQDFARAQALMEANALTQTDYDSAKAQLDSTSGSVKTAEGALKNSKQALADCKLTAPMDAWVANRNVDVGDFASTGTSGFTLVDTRQVKAMFGVPDTVLAKVQLGQKQRVMTEALPQAFEGRITAISPQADTKSRSFQVEVTIPNPRNELKSGMIATLDVGQGKLEHPLTVVPLSAIVSPSEGLKTFMVYVVAREGQRDVAHQRQVELGDTYGNRVAILQGVTAGERVISNGANYVRDGDAVQVLP
jgi:multidrug efflux system membrane fusion protein